MTINELYEPMLGREIAPIEKAVRQFRESHSSEELFRAISQFALLAASPSQHGKHALLACIAAKEIEQTMGERYDELLARCASYAALSRLPWSEPPITEPPEYSPGDEKIEVIREAIASRDRLRGERWLAARLAQRNIAGDFFTIASEDLSDFGHKLIVAVGVWKLAQMHDRPESYRFLRVAIGEWTSYAEETGGASDVDVPRDQVIDSVVTGLVAEKGSLESFHRVATCDAAIEAARFAADPLIESRVLSRLRGELREMSGQIYMPPNNELPIYSLARDYAEYLKSFAIAHRLGRPEIIAAAKYNRDHGPSFEEWSFA